MHPYPANPNVSAVDEVPEDARDFGPIKRMETLLADSVALRERPADAIRSRSLWEVDLREAGLAEPFEGRIVSVPVGLEEGGRFTDEQLETTRWEPKWVDETIYAAHAKLGRLMHGRNPPSESFLTERLERWDAWMSGDPEKQIERNRAGRFRLEKERRERWDHLIGALDYPERPLMIAATPNFVEAHDTYIRAVNWLESGSKMLTVFGESSTGKTTALMALMWHDMGLKRWVDDGTPLPGAVRYIRSVDLLRMSAEKGRKDVARPEEAIEKATVLVIDEVGAESVWADRVASYYDRLIDRRYCDLGCYTVLLSNSGAGRLTELLGQRTMRRLTEDPARMFEATQAIMPGQQHLG